MLCRCGVTLLNKWLHRQERESSLGFSFAAGETGRWTQKQTDTLQHTAAGSWLKGKLHTKLRETHIFPVTWSPFYPSRVFKFELARDIVHRDVCLLLNVMELDGTRPLWSSRCQKDTSEKLKSDVFSQKSWPFFTQHNPQTLTPRCNFFLLNHCVERGIHLLVDERLILLTVHNVNIKGVLIGPRCNNSELCSLA